MFRTIAMVALSTFAAGNAVWGQSQGDSKVRAACRPDVMRFCKEFVKEDKNEDVVSILNCLESNKSNEQGMSQVFASHGQ